MTNEEKQLLIKDLTSRLPYITYYDLSYYGYTTRAIIQEFIPAKELLQSLVKFNTVAEPISYENAKPYLRQMFSITNEEFQFLQENIPYDFTRIYSNEFNLFDDIHLGNTIFIDDVAFLLDTLNKWHLDYRGLIKMGLALPAPEGMYVIIS